MTSFRTFLLIALAVVMVAPAVAADIAGTWTSEFETPIGTLHYTYVFKVDGTTLTGTAKWEQGSSEITEGKVTGDEISFVENTSVEGMDLRISYKGKISGDEIKLTRVVGDFGTEEIALKRAQ